MTSKIYLLRSDSRKCSSFIEDFDEEMEDSIMERAVKNPWQSFDSNYTAIKLELNGSDTGVKNYRFDFSGALRPFYVFSELALTLLNDILEPRGQILPVLTKSKKKQFIGYYPTNPLLGCFDKKISIFREYPNGFLIEKPILISSNITDEYLFSIEEDISRVFVTDKFKQRVEEAGLLGFDFSFEIETS